MQSISIPAACGLFDVSHMGRLLIEGPDRVAFLQHVLSCNVMALDVKQAQYAIIPDENGSAIDDAYLYKFNEGNMLLVVNAANTEKDRHITIRSATPLKRKDNMNTEM